MASQNASIPVINAGDGGHHHPTQTLADLLTIKHEKGRLKDLTIGFCGDLKFGRTVHSLITALCRYENINFVMISPDELKLPGYVKNEIPTEGGFTYKETTDLEAVMPELDILYMTRVQQERFDDIEEYLRLRDAYILTPEKLESAKSDLIVLHPLPRVNEISVAIDDDPRACYFKQVRNGKYMRMALILKLIREAEQNPTRVQRNTEGTYLYDYKCDNPRCITTTEQELKQIFRVVSDEHRICRCVYCDTKKKY